jgi:hypothetical protein
LWQNSTPQFCGSAIVIRTNKGAQESNFCLGTSAPVASHFGNRAQEIRFTPGKAATLGW